MAASAAYGLACAAHEIILNPDAEVGSVGVVVRLMNDSEHLKQEGYERSFVYAGKNKIPYATDGSFRKEFLDDIQSHVDALYEQFTGFVAEYRDIPVEAVVATQASVFMAKDAVAKGMADSIKTREEFFLYLADISDKQKQNGGMMIPKLFGQFNKQKEQADMSEIAALQERLGAIEASNADLVAKLAAYETDMATLVEQVASAQAERDAAKALLQAQEDAQAAAAQAAAEAKDKARLDALKEAVGDVEAEAAFADLKELSDEAFARTVSRMAAAVDKTNEILGDKGFTVEQTAQEEIDPTAKILQQRYNKGNK
jgi:ClpP class serine protease